MVSPQELVESLLAEKAAMQEARSVRLLQAYEKYYAPEYLQHFAAAHARFQKNPENFSRAEVMDTEATIYTTQIRIGDLPEQYRYELRLTDGRWRIHGMASECFACRGTGAWDGKRCDICRGQGWKDHMRDASTSPS